MPRRLARHSHYYPSFPYSLFYTLLFEGDVDGLGGLWGGGVVVEV